MIRWYPTNIGNLGFHGIPIHVGERSSRTRRKTSSAPASPAAASARHNTDAAFMWEFATVGTTVVVT